MGDSFFNYLKVIKRSDKILLCNSLTGSWIRLSTNVFNIIKSILDEGLNINELRESFECLDDYEFIKDMYEQLQSAGYIVSNEPIIKNSIVYFEMTHRCNLHCIHCCIDADNTCEKNKDLSTDNVKKVFDKFIEWSPQTIVLSGGEVMLRKDFGELLNYLRDNFKGKIIISTNGTLINEINVKRLCILCDQIDISLDGINEETTSITRGKGVFNKVINSVKLIKNTGFNNVSLSMVVGDKNYYLKDEFEKLNNELGTKAMIRMFEPAGRGKKSEHIFSNLEDSQTYIPIDFFTNKTIHCSTCSAGRRELFVDYKGDIYPCPSYTDEEYKMGNVLKINSIDDIIKNLCKLSAYKNMCIKSPFNRESCRNCSVREFCWTCPAKILGMKSENSVSEVCKKVKPVLVKKVWGEE